MNDFLSTHCNPPNAATLEVLCFELRDEIRKLKAERDDARATADRLEGELARLAKERDDLARAAGAAVPIGPEGLVYHFRDGGTVTIRPGR